MSAGNTPVRDVGVGSGTTVHGQGGDVLIASGITDPLPVLWSRTYRGFYDGA